MKINIIKRISLLLSGLMIFSFSLIKYILSFEFYQDEWGTDISFNSDYLIALIIGILVITLSLYYLIKKDNKINHLISFLLTTILSFYSLGVLFKALNKGENFSDYQTYFYIGLVSFMLFIYFAISLYEKYKTEKDK